MSRVVWDDIGARLFEFGIDRGIIFVGDQGIPWNGLTQVEEKASGGQGTPYYYDGQKYLNVPTLEEYAATITALTYPDAFMVCDGTAQIDTGLFIAHQPQVPFNFSYRTKIGNDVAGQDFAYRIHLIYGALAEPATRTYKTMTETPDSTDFSWDVALTPPQISGYRSSGHLIVDTRVAHPGTMTDLENLLYGSDTSDPTFPSLADIQAIVTAYADFFVIDHGDGTYELSAPATALTTDGTTWELDSTAVTTSGDTLTIMYT